MRLYTVDFKYFQTNTRRYVYFIGAQVLAYKKSQVIPTVRKWTGVRRGARLKVVFLTSKKWTLEPKVIHAEEWP